MLRLPNPTILPPAVDVVRNHASTANVCGPSIAVVVETRPALLPGNPAAVSASPSIAPVAPHVTPLPAVAGEVPAQSSAVVAPACSDRRQ